MRDGMDPAEGRLVDGRYEVGHLLGAGGAAEVFLARDGVLNRTVALKVLDWRLTFEGKFVPRFEREACIAASISHPNVVTVYDLGKTEDGSPYIAMEYVDGGTLKDLVAEEGPLEARRAARLALKISCALQAAHQRGLIHRDIKPQNVLLTNDGEAKVADFGVAKATEATSFTEPGSLLGTVHYLSPEQAAGQALTPRSDLYSLGIVLYEMLSATRPFEAESWEEGPLAIVNKRLTRDPEPLRDLVPDTPAWLEQATMRLLARDPEERFADAAELAEVLRKELRIAEGPADRPGTYATPTQPESCGTGVEATVSTSSGEGYGHRVPGRTSSTVPLSGSRAVRRRKRRRATTATMAIVLIVSVMLAVAGTTLNDPEVDPPQVPSAVNGADAGDGQGAGSGMESPLVSAPNADAPVVPGSTSTQDQYR